MNLHDLEKDLKVIADKTRLLIIKEIADGQHCGCDLITKLDITQPTLSHHLKVLKEAGYIEGLKHGQRVNYQIQRDKFQQVIDEVITLLKSDKECLEGA